MQSMNVGDQVKFTQYGRTAKRGGQIVLLAPREISGTITGMSRGNKGNQYIVHTTAGSETVHLPN